MASNAPKRTLDVTAFLQDAGMTPFHYRLLIISCLVTFFDGMDFSLVSVALPEIQEGLKLENAMLGYVSSAAFLGQMIGSLAGSYLADVFGRRPVILWCTAIGAVLTFATGFATSAEMLIVLRLFGGLAIGGLLAPAWAINIEAMPNSYRATAVTIIMLGFSVGGAAAAQTTNLIAPTYGWEGVFFFAGAATGLLAVVLQFTMPESARWMVAKGKPAAEVLPLLSRFDPGVGQEGYTELVLSDERKQGGSSPWAKSAALFKGQLAWITPIIWVTYFCSSFAIYIKASFGVKFLQVLDVPVDTARDLSSIGGLIGAVGAVFLLMFTERKGPIWIAAAPLLGVPLALLIGTGAVPVGGEAFIAVIMLGMITIGVGHASVISITSIYYPSAVRATGGGWASFMAKFAAVLAPIIASQMFLANKRAVLDGYSFVGLCLAGVVVGIVALAFFARRLGAERDAEAGLSGAVAEPAE
ncbi:MFS transporter [Altererythrobacter salegens]|uniref:MFS transporter n=1 Tax=Croceibacterium salegens TaxID=1737568 RepID=A0A6I4SWW1_9SPHN|nr:MFS transporter [Croceibacterium salegens]MXO59839.1 MFS transporter [Croceibacterium salegens]